MKKLFLAILSGLLILPATTISAQTSEPYSAVQVSFFPPLSTNGRDAGLYTNDFSLNILAGVSKNEQLLAFAGLANVIKNDANGLQWAGLCNYIGNKARGLQFAGLANYVGDEAKGLQWAGLGNIVMEDFEGLQFAGLANISQDIDGLQFAGLGNISKDVEGLQFGGLGNISADVQGLQFGGLFNKAKNVCGVQFAGLVNIANRSDYPIGLVNIIKEGEMGVALGYNELGTASLTFRSGGRVLYGILGVGYNHEVKDDKDALTIIAGYGAHINICPKFRINNELTMESFGVFSDSDDEPDTFKAGYALLPAYRLGQFEIFAGPSVNYMQTKNADMYDIFPKNSLWDEKSNSGKLQKVYVGWQAGVSFNF